MVCGMSPEAFDRFAWNLFREDAPYGDRTTEALELRGRMRGRFLVKDDLVACGLPAARRVFELADPECLWTSRFSEGDAVKEGNTLAFVRGELPALLLAERTALNLLQRLCGIASMTRRLTEAVRGSGLRVCDTRKTTPGLRLLEKYAVRVGGGANHRMGLSDGILIKDNHIAAVGSLSEAVRRARARGGALWRVEVEVSSLEEYGEAVAAGADVIMLDNMSDEDMGRAVRAKPAGVLLEASGGVTAERLPAIAALGVDLVSMGALTHSVKASDISLELEADPDAA